jgi:UDP-GlcNAc:undecaprenyl-phosphate GlcNAc-1-phosphate transferase
MTALLTAFFSSVLLALVLTPFCRSIAVRYGLVDRPDAFRKTHVGPVPRIGGVAVLIACLAPMLFASPTAAKGLVPAVLVVFAAGLWDDLRGLKPWRKMAGLSIAAWLAWLSGVRLDGLGGWAAPVWCSFPLTVLWLVGCANAINLIDGLDGLATGIGLFATLTTMIAALLQGHFALALATAPLAGALIGFLRYNFNPASIFLGDCGSLPLGFLLGAYSAIWSQKTATILGMTAPVIALSVPLLDTLVAIARRFLSGRPIFGADRRHIHHRLLDRGLTPRMAALLLYAACAAAAILSLAIQLGRGHFTALIPPLCVAAAWAGIRCLGYAEFDIVGRLLQPRTFRSAIDGQMRLRVLEDTLVGASTVEECFAAVRRASLDLGFDQLAMRLDHTLYEEPLSRQAAAGQCWTLHIPLSDTEYVKVSHRFHESVPLTIVEPFAGIVRRTLEPKLAAFHAGVSGATPVRIITPREIAAISAPQRTPPKSATASSTSQDLPGTIS